jgi:hypothetical protein
VDTFAGSNVLSVVVEVPKAMLGTASTLNVWAETKKKTIINYSIKIKNYDNK